MLTEALCLQLSLDTTWQTSYVYWLPQIRQEQGLTPCGWTVSDRVNGRQIFSKNITLLFSQMDIKDPLGMVAQLL